MTHTMTAATATGTFYRSGSRSKEKTIATPSGIRPEGCTPQKRPVVKERPYARRNARKSLPAGFWMALIAWVIAIFIMSGSLNETFSLAEPKPQLIEIQVEKGDTLWGIAQELNNSVFNHEHDLRYLIYVIEEHNGLNSPIIQPGQILKIPLDL